MSKAVATKEETLPALPAEVLSILDEHAGEGQSFDHQDMVIPILSILHMQSPQLDAQKSSYVEGAKAGQLYLNTEGRTFDQLEIAILAHAHVVVGWRERDSGGGFLGAYRQGTEPGGLIQLPGEFIRRDPNDQSKTYQETIQYIAAIFGENREPLGAAFIVFKSTQMKFARRQNAVIATRRVTTPEGRKIPAPCWSYLYPVSTMPERNQKGSWYSWKFGDGQLITDPDLLRLVRDMAKDIDPEAFFRSREQSAIGGDASETEATTPF